MSEDLSMSHEPPGDLSEPSFGFSQDNSVAIDNTATQKTVPSDAGNGEEEHNDYSQSETKGSQESHDNQDTPSETSSYDRNTATQLVTPLVSRSRVRLAQIGSGNLLEVAHTLQSSPQDNTGMHTDTKTPFQSVQTYQFPYMGSPTQPNQEGINSLAFVYSPGSVQLKRSRRTFETPTRDTGGKKVASGGKIPETLEQFASPQTQQDAEQAEVSPPVFSSDSSSHSDIATQDNGTQFATQQVKRVDPETAKRLFLMGRHSQVLPETVEDGPGSPPDAASDCEEPIQVFGTPRDVFSRPTPDQRADLNVITSDNDNDHENENDKAKVVETPWMFKNHNKSAMIEETPLRARTLGTQDASYSLSLIPENGDTPTSKFRRLPPKAPSRPSSNTLSMLVKWESSWYPAYISDRQHFEALRENPRSHVTVTFGTDEVGDIKPKFAVPLELEVGNVVNYRGSTRYVVVELLREAEAPLFVTESGYDHLVLKRLQNKKGPFEVDVFTVCVKDIYMNAAVFRMWKEHQLQPSEDDQLNGVIPPLKRARIAEPIPVRPDGFFRNCLFAVTMESHDEASQITQLITDNGGVMLENGISELLAIDYDAMRLKWQGYPWATFGAVIATRPLKTPKYLEGLACGWPCLSYQFVFDCSSNDEFLDNWSDYCLSAGESTILNSQVSQNISDFRSLWQHQSPLGKHFAQRWLPLGPVAAPIYLLDKDENNSIKLLLMAITSKAPIPISKLTDAPEGAIVLDTDRRAKTLSSCTADLRLRLSRQSTLPETVVFGKEWLIQCLINRRIV